MIKKPNRAMLWRFAIRLLIACGIIWLIRPTAIGVQRWLEQDAPAQPSNEVLRAAQRSEDVAVPLSSTSLSPHHALVIFLSEQETRPWDGAARRHYTDIRQQHGDSAPALAFFTYQPPTRADVPLLRDMIDRAVSQEDWGSATRHLDLLLTLVPDDALAHYQLGLILSLDTPPDALPHLEQAQTSSSLSESAVIIQRAIEQGGTPHQIGRALMDIEEWTLARHAFDRAIALNQADWLSYAYRGYVKDQLGQTGIEDYEIAIAYAPTEALAYYFIGLHWRTVEEDYEAAVDAFAAAYQFEPDNSALAIEVARTYQLMNKPQRAQEWFNIAIALSPDEVQWHQLRAAFIVDFEYRLADEGLAALQDSVDRFSNDAFLVASLGYAHYLLQHEENAKAYLRKALDIDPESARSHYYYGLVLHRSGDIEEARTAYLAAIRIVGNEAGYGYLASRALQSLEQ